MSRVRRNYAYNVGDIANAVPNWTLTCTKAGTTSIDPVDIQAGTIIDGTCEWNCVNSGGGAVNNYSTTEQRIGTWIDGKPLYQITVDCGTLPNTTYKNIQTNVSNVKDIINIKGTCYSSSGFWRSIPKIQDDSTNYTVVPQISFDNNKMIVQLLGRGGDNTSFISSYVTIQYTKTTD